MALMQVPPEILLDIVSWLPTTSIVRLSSVNKTFHSIIQRLVSCRECTLMIGNRGFERLGGRTLTIGNLSIPFGRWCNQRVQLWVTRTRITGYTSFTDLFAGSCVITEYNTKFDKLITTPFGYRFLCVSDNSRIRYTLDGDQITHIVTTVIDGCGEDRVYDYLWASDWCKCMYATPRYLDSENQAVIVDNGDYEEIVYLSLPEGLVVIQEIHTPVSCAGYIMYFKGDVIACNTSLEGQPSRELYTRVFRETQTATTVCHE